MKLRPYQEQVIEDLRQGIREGHKRQILALATGAGKTIVASAIIRNAVANGNRCIFIVDRKTLVHQAVKHLHEIGLSVGVVQGINTEYTPQDDVIVATVQSLKNRTPFHWIGLCIIDEAHILHAHHVELFEHWSAIPFIGLSATPLTRGLGKHFTRLVRGPTIRELVEMGSLVPMRGYAPSEAVLAEVLKEVATGNTTHGKDYQDKALAEAMNTKHLVGDIIETYEKHGEGRQALCFAVDIAHSQALADEFNANGIAAGHVDGYMTDEDSDAVMAAFKAGDIAILCSVYKLGVGFDYPAVSCAILARPTLSEMLHLQQLGRVLRPWEGKVDALILDHSGNCVRFGLPIDFEVPELNSGDKEKSSRRNSEPKMQTCGECGYLLEPGQMTCPACGIDRPVREADVQYTDADLVEIGTDGRGQKGYTHADYRRWYLGIRRHWEEKGKSHDKACGIAFYAIKEKFGFNPPWSWRDIPSIEPDRDVQNYLTSKRIRYAKRRRAEARPQVGSI